MTTATDIVAAYSIDEQLAHKIVSVARNLDIEPAHLANVIAFESGGKFSATAINPRSGASGLIQFIPRTAQELGTTIGAIRAMNAMDQMDLVGAYFKMPRIRAHGPLRTQLDVYMAVFYPPAIGKGLDYAFSSDVRASNPGINYARDYFAYAAKWARLPFDGESPGGGATGEALLAVGGVLFGILLWWLWPSAR